MSGRKLVIGYDVGTSGSKAVLCGTDGRILASDFEPYGVRRYGHQFAEQDPDDWWNAVATNSRRLLERAVVCPEDIAGVSFATQMLGVVPVSGDGEPLYPGIIWMDCRAEKQAARIVRRFGGRRVLTSLVGAVPSGKDVICKIKWIEEEEPEVFARTRAFLDTKGYVLLKATGEFLTDQSAASVTGLMDNRTRDWSKLMSRLLGTTLSRMPEVRESAEVAGGLREEAAMDTGLQAGTPVVTGMGDAPAGALGAGVLEHGESVISVGTSGLLCISVSDRVNLGKYGIASIAATDPSMWLLVGETNTAGECLKWFSEQLATSGERSRGEEEGSVFRVMDEVAEMSPAGANGLIFTPWMYGERAPVTDTAIRGAFLNLSLDHTRTDMLRAVYEGVAMNFRWMFEAAQSKRLPCERVRAIGGGANSDAWMRVFADVTGRTVEAVLAAQEAGALGAALAALVALGEYADYSQVRRLVQVRKTFTPNRANKDAYDRLFHQFTRLYGDLAPVYHSLNH